jgi:hypothetical protein
LEDGRKVGWLESREGIDIRLYPFASNSPPTCQLSLSWNSKLTPIALYCLPPADIVLNGRLMKCGEVEWVDVTELIQVAPRAQWQSV